MAASSNFVNLKFISQVSIQNFEYKTTKHFEELRVTVIKTVQTNSLYTYPLLN